MTPTRSPTAERRPRDRRRRTDQGRGRGFAPAARPRRGRRGGPPRDLRGAPLLRAARRRPDARRGHRHRRPDLRHLPGRLPDDRGPRLRARARRSRSTRRSGCFAASSTAASGSRAMPSTSTCSTCPTSSATTARSSLPPTGGGPSRRVWPSRRPATSSSASSAAGRSIRCRSGSAASPAPSGGPRSPRSAEPLDHALEIALTTVELVAGLETPDFEREARLVALRHADRVPDERGPDRLDRRPRHRAPGRGRPSSGERQVAWSHALQSRGRDERPYLLGPASRITLDADRLHPLAAAALARTGLAEEIRTNPYRSIVARAVELVDAVAEALDLIDAYQPPADAAAPWRPGPGSGGLGDRGPTRPHLPFLRPRRTRPRRHARIVPPTSQNQAAIEADLATFAPRVLDLPRAEATHRIEQLIRSYDPCISCATHFLDLTVEAMP